MMKKEMHCEFLKKFLSNPTKWCHFCFQHFKIIVYWKETSFFFLILFQRETWSPGLWCSTVCDSHLCWETDDSMVGPFTGKYNVQLINTEVAGPWSLADMISNQFDFSVFPSNSFPLYLIFLLFLSHLTVASWVPFLTFSISSPLFS